MIIPTKFIEPIIHTLSKPQLPLYFTLAADNAQLRRFSVLRAAVPIQTTTPPQQQVFHRHFNGTSTLLSRTFHLRTLHLNHPSSAFSGLRNFDVQGKVVRFRLNCRGFCGNTNSSDGGNVDADIVDHPKDVERVCKMVEEWVTDGHVKKADLKEVERVCKIVQELFAFDLHPHMEAALDGCGIDLTHDLVVNVLERFKRAPRPAFRFFSWARQKPGFCHDSSSYNSMMAILGRSRRFDTVVTMLEDMGAKGLLTDKSIHIYIRAFAAANESEKVLRMILELMKRLEVGFNCLLDNPWRAKLGKEAQQLFEKLEGKAWEGSFTPNLQIAYAILINNWVRVKSLSEAEKIWNEMLWNEMLDKGFKPDIVAHNWMLEGLSRAKKSSGAIKMFEYMKANGPAPNVQSYKIVIRDLRKQKKMNEAVEYFEEMIESGCKPDVSIYTSLIIGFGKENKMDKVYRLLTEMKEKGYTPDNMMYIALMKLMAKCRLLDNSMRIYKKMIQSGIQPTHDTYNMLLKSCFKAKNPDMARTVWEEMYRNGCGPDLNSYIVFIRGLVKQDELVEACQYLEEMIEKETAFPQLDYDKFEDYFIRAGKPDVLDELALRMTYSGKFKLVNVFARWAKSKEFTVTLSLRDILFGSLHLGSLVLLLFLAWQLVTNPSLFNLVILVTFSGLILAFLIFM